MTENYLCFLFFALVRYVLSELNIVCVFFSKENADQEACCWRNLFSCINLVRILQKLTKWKHSRTMVNMLFFLFRLLHSRFSFSCPVSDFEVAWNFVGFCFLVITGSYRTICPWKCTPVPLLPPPRPLTRDQCLLDVCFANKNCLSDACCVQVCSDLEARIKSETRTSSAVCTKG